MECPRPQLLLRDWPVGPPDPPVPDKKTATSQHLRWLTSLTDSDLVLYSDGSQLTLEGQIRTGWGFVAWRAGRVIHRHSGALAKAEVFDVEAQAAREAVQ